MCLVIGSTAIAQMPAPDKSPMDVSYAPHNYPIQKFQGNNTPELPFARVIYSRPQKNGRELFGKEIRYNQLWRLGANEATEIEFFKNATFNGKRVPKGRYTMYCIPKENTWTIILNKDNFSWGAFSYKAANDLLRTNVATTSIANQPAEYFTMYFDAANHLVIMWDNVRVVIPVVF